MAEAIKEFNKTIESLSKTARAMLDAEHFNRYCFMCTIERTSMSPLHVLSISSWFLMYTIGMCFECSVQLTHLACTLSVGT